jgi:urease accessory protein
MVREQRLLLLLQWFDTSFPTGAYTQSLGLETYIQEGVVRDGATLEEFVCAYLAGPLLYTDAIALRHVYEWVLTGQTERVWTVDGLLTAQCLPSEVREGMRRMGERILRLMGELFPDQDVWSEYLIRVQERSAHGHPAVVFGLALAEAGIRLSSGLAAYLFSSVNALVQNGVRAIPLGQTEGQRILLRLHPRIAACAQRAMELGWQDFGTVSPGLELAQMRHERLDVRIFMS